MCPNPSQAPDDSSISEPTASRRSVLTTTATAAAAGSFAGCLGILPGNDEGTDNPGSEPPSLTPNGSTSPAWTEWAYPRGFRDQAAEYDLRLFDVDRILANRDQMMTGFPGFVERQMVDFDVYLGEIANLEDLTSAVEIDGNYVFNGPWSKSAAEESVGAFKGTTEAGSKGDYTLYEVRGEPLALAVADGQFITGRLEESEPNFEKAMPVLEALLDAKAGSRERYTVANQDVASVLEGAAADSQFYHQAIFYDEEQESNYGIGDIVGATGERTTWALEDGTITGTLLYIFASEEDANKQTVQDYADSSESLTNWTDLKVTEESPRIIRIDGTVGA